MVDDGSQEPVVLPQCRHNVRLVRQRRKGANPARSAGLKLARGCYVHFHDSDDDFHDDWFLEVFPFLRNGQADVILTGRKEALPDGTTRVRISRFAQYHARRPAFIGRRLRYENTLGPFGGVIFRREILNKITFLGLDACQDWQIYGALYWSTLTIAVIDAPLLISNKRGCDRISQSMRRRTLGHLQLARHWKLSKIGQKRLRLFYLWRLRRDLKSGVSRHEGRLWRLARPHAIALGISWEVRLVAQGQFASILSVIYVKVKRRLLGCITTSPNA